MDRHEEIKNAYKSLGGEATFYDGMITCSTLSGKAVCKLVWNMDRRKNGHYLELALSGIPQNFSSKMLEVPVGTGILSMPVYEMIPDADITCLDYSPDMMERAKRQAGKRGFKIFCGCFYVKGENKRTDWFIEKIYTPKGYFTPPYETAHSLEKRLKAMYRKTEVKTVEGMAAFWCRNGSSDGK